MRALSVRQPWAWLIVNGHKPIENRDWSTKYRGEFLVHASKTCARKYYLEVAAHVLNEFGITVPAFETIERGGVVGAAEIIDCLTAADILDYDASHQCWFTGEYGFLLANARPMPFHPSKGSLSFFDVPGLRP